MKTKLLVSFLALSCLSAQLCATVVRAQVWQRPNGTHAIILGDDIEACPAEKQQIIDCSNYLKSVKNPYVLKINQLSSEFASEISKVGIPHDVLVFTTPDDLDSCNRNITPLAKTFLAYAQQSQETISAKLKDDYNTLLESFATHVKTLRDIESLPSGHDDCCTECNPYLCSPSMLNRMFEIAQSLFDYILVSRLENNAATQSLVILDPSMMDSLTQALPKLGYKQTASYGTFTDKAADAMYMQKLDAQQATHPKNCNGTCCSEDGDLNEDPIMQEVMNHFALNLQEIFKRWTPSAPGYPHYADPFRKDHARFTPPAPHTADTMTAAQFQQWSDGYDRDMREESLPIRGFGLN